MTTTTIENWSNAEMWENLVGSQSPEDFMEYSESSIVEIAVNAYATMKNFNDMWGEHGISESEIINLVRPALIAYLEENI